MTESSAQRNLGAHSCPGHRARQHGPHLTFKQAYAEVAAVDGHAKAFR